MPSTDPAAILISSNRWANEQLLDSCAPLTTEQFHQEFEMGLGSLHATATHILGAMRGWSDLLAGRTQRDRLEAGGPYTVADLRSLHADIADDFAALATAYPHEESVSGERGGRTYTFTRGAVLTHVTTHGMHHRAQCINMLRQLGADSLPKSAVLEWMIEVDGQG